MAFLAALGFLLSKLSLDLIVDNDKLPQNWKDHLQKLESLLEWSLNSSNIEQFLKSFSDIVAEVEDTDLELFLSEMNEDFQASMWTKQAVFNKEILPRYKELDIALVRKYLREFHEKEKFTNVTEQFNVKSLTQNEAIIELDLLERDFIEEFYKISNVTIECDGTKNGAQVFNFMQQCQDRAEREKIYRKYHMAKLDSSSKVDEIFTKLTETRQKKSEVLGLENYIGFAWKRRQRDSYSREQSWALAEAIPKVFQDRFQSISRRISDYHTITDVRPWDLAPNLCENQGISEATYVELLVNSFSEINPEFGSLVKGFYQAGSLDFMASKTKHGGGNFSYAYKSKRQVGVHGNATGSLSDTRNLMHECGHALHDYYAFDNPFVWQKQAAGDLGEFIAYVMQMLASDYLLSSGFVSEEQWKLYQLYVGNFILSVFWEDSADERYQQWLYDQKALPSVEERDSAYMSFRPSSPINEDGLDIFLKKKWHTHHVIVEPFYSFDYSIALIASLLTVGVIQQDKKRTLNSIEEIMKRGNTINIAEALSILGLNFPFTQADLKKAGEVFDMKFIV